MSSAPLDLELPAVEINSYSAHCAPVQAASRLAGFGLEDAKVKSSAAVWVDPHEPSSPELEDTSDESLDDFECNDGVARSTVSWAHALPAAQGLYDPDNEKDACGVGFICHIKGYSFPRSLHPRAGGSYLCHAASLHTR
jgi:hypothetical protein